MREFRKEEEDLAVEASCTRQADECSQFGPTCGKSPSKLRDQYNKISWCTISQEATISSANNAVVAVLHT